MYGAFVTLWFSPTAAMAQEAVFVVVLLIELPTWPALTGGAEIAIDSAQSATNALFIFVLD